MNRSRQSRSIDFRRGLAQYVPLKRLAVGGMAEVWRGEARFEDGEVLPIAIKRVLPDLAKNPVYRGMFEDEARVGMLLRHRNIVRVYDRREVQGTFIMIMELVEGPSLRSLLARAQKREATMPYASALHIARELCRALRYAHESMDEWGRNLDIVHRDVSPHNVLLGSDGAVKLMDFGLANATANATSREDMVGGKLAYLAPEVVTRNEVSPLIDVFALGVILWEALAGRRLFAGANDEQTVQNVIRCQIPPPSLFDASIPTEVDQLVARALAADPAKRFQSALEFGQTVHAMLKSMPGEVGAEDVALMVRLHQSSERAERTGRHRVSSVPPSASSANIARILEDELRAFEEREGASGVGALPLDPQDVSEVNTRTSKPPQSNAIPSSPQRR